MKWKNLAVLVGISCLSWHYPNDFLSEQTKFERVRKAIQDKKALLETTLNKHQISINELNILLIAYKNTDTLEIYAKNKAQSSYEKVFSYRICARSGNLGPKRQEGDGQVPEGFYYVSRFNPTSNFYLSLGINYPNHADKIKSNAKNLGGDIFIHGACVTIGCLPMTDDIIQEIYLLAVYAKNSGQTQIPVYIFPFPMTTQNIKTAETLYRTNTSLETFWNNLKIGYDKFAQDKKALSVKIAPNGDYTY